MTSPGMKKAPRAGGAFKNRSSNPFQEKEITMNTSFAQADQFATIRVADLTVAPNQLIGGGEPATDVVTIRTRDELLTFTPAEACALAAALQAVAVHVMESEPREIHRTTAPGEPDLAGRGGGR